MKQITFLNGKLSDLAKDYIMTVLSGDRHDASKLIMNAFEQGMSIQDMYLRVFQPCQYEIGDLWESGQVSVAQEHYFTATSQVVLSQLYSHFPFKKSRGKQAIITCAAGELHEVGARMVADFLEFEGWDTFFTGANTPVPDIIHTIDELNASLLGVSVTIAYNLPMAMDLISEVRESFPPEKLKIVVGGRAFSTSEKIWRKTAADGYASSAEESIQLARDYFPNT
ncbi:MAG: cobalamin-dependent protein [Spirochaetia bacterium]|nr:cobalamin-dependent protein [Spirochaetia bacterium]